MSNDPKDPPSPAQDLFPFDEMSTGETSSLIRRAHALTGKPDEPVPSDPALKPMTGAQLAFRPSAPPRPVPGGKPATGSHAAFKPGTGTQPAFKPGGTGTQPAFKPGGTGTQPAFKPGGTGTQPAFKPGGTGTQPAFRPTQPSPARRPATGSQPAYQPPPRPVPQVEEEEAPVFDAERLQSQIRAMSLTDSALGRAVKAQKPNKVPTSAAEDTFVKARMKQAEAKVPDFDLDEDLG